MLFKIGFGGVDMKKIVLFITFMLLLSTYGFSCFDTYLFLNGKSMVYPAYSFAGEVLLEYSANKISLPEEDTFLSVFNVYCGLSERISFQAGVSSAEITRTDNYSIEEVGFRSVFNLVSSRVFVSEKYYLDAVLECKGNIINGSLSFEGSLPNIFYIGNFATVVHPVFGLQVSDLVDFTLGGHLGIFYIFNQLAVVGVGFEYQSAQSSSQFGNRLVEGEMAMSLFFGSKIGENFYLQNEFAKGLANSRDFGFAATIKTVF